jgi:hypothetical protein
MAGVDLDFRRTVDQHPQQRVDLLALGRDNDSIPVALDDVLGPGDPHEHVPLVGGDREKLTCLRRRALGHE